MALTVGTNTYLTVADFTAWATLRGLDLSPFSNEQIEAALVVSSSDFIDVNYKFKGQVLDATQPMALPTTLVAINDIYKGAAQSAWQALNDQLFVSPSANSAGQVISQRDKLDVLETETEYAENSATFYTHDTTQITRLLSKYTVGNVGGNMARVRKC